MGFGTNSANVHARHPRSKVWKLETLIINLSFIERLFPRRNIEIPQFIYYGKEHANILVWFGLVLVCKLPFLYNMLIYV